MNKFNLCLYAIAAVSGVVSGLCFSRAQYHKGRIDAANEFKEELIKFKEELEEEVES